MAKARTSKPKEAKATSKKVVAAKLDPGFADMVKRAKDDVKRTGMPQTVVQQGKLKVPGVGMVDFNFSHAPAVKKDNSVRGARANNVITSTAEAAATFPSQDFPKDRPKHWVPRDPSTLNYRVAGMVKLEAFDVHACDVAAVSCASGWDDFVAKHKEFKSAATATAPITDVLWRFSSDGEMFKYAIYGILVRNDINEIQILRRLSLHMLYVRFGDVIGALNRVMNVLLEVVNPHNFKRTPRFLREAHYFIHAIDGLTNARNKIGKPYSLNDNWLTRAVTVSPMLPADVHEAMINSGHMLKLINELSEFFRISGVQFDDDVLTPLRYVNSLLSWFTDITPFNDVKEKDKGEWQSEQGLYLRRVRSSNADLISSRIKEAIVGFIAGQDANLVELCSLFA